MKIKYAPLDPNALTTVLGGSYIRNTKHGIVIQRKPSHNKGLNSPVAKAWQTRFGFAATMASSATSMEYETAFEMSKGTEQVPRDILTMAALGDYYLITNPDGWQWPKNPSPILFDRAELGETMWEWSQHDAAWTTAMDATARATKGVLFTPPFNDKFYGVRTIFTGVVNAIYRLYHGTTNAGNIIQTITASNPKVTTAAGLQLQQFVITSQFEAGVKNFFLLTRTDNVAAYALPINVQTVQRWQFPLQHQGFITLLSVAPAVGNTLTIAAAASCPPFGFLVNQ